MGLIEAIRRLFSKNEQADAGPATLRDDLGGGFYCTYRELPNGFGGYHAVDMRLRKEAEPGFCRRITRSDGSFVHFPGVEHGSWEKQLDMPFRPAAMFRNELCPLKNGRAEFQWLLQPDGRYFADEDGFGAEDCTEIWLHSYVDEQGRFLEPFSRYDGC